MSRLADPPFIRGKTYSGTGTPGSTDGAHLVGREWVFEDLDYSVTGQPKPVRSNRNVTVRAVRNSCTINSGGEITTGNLLPKRAVTFTAGGYNTTVDGYARTTAQGPAVLVDEFLPSAGVAPNDVFYVVTEGPAMGLMDPGQIVNISYNDNLVALTGATSGATTAGRVAGAVYTNLTSSNLADPIRNSIGRALTAATSGNTAGNILVDVTKLN